MEYMGRPVAKQVVHVGTGGEVELPPELVGAAGRSRVIATVEFVLGKDSHKFEKDGTVTYSRILTIDADAFSVEQVIAPPPEAEQPTLEEAEGEAPVTHEIKRDAVEDTDDGTLYIAGCSCGEGFENFDESEVDAWEKEHLEEVGV